MSEEDVSNMPRVQIVRQLNVRNVEFPVNSTVEELRVLYQEIVTADLNNVNTVNPNNVNTVNPNDVNTVNPNNVNTANPNNESTTHPIMSCHIPLIPLTTDAMGNFIPDPANLHRDEDAQSQEGHAAREGAERCRVHAFTVGQDASNENNVERELLSLRRHREVLLLRAEIARLEGAEARPTVSNATTVSNAALREDWDVPSAMRRFDYSDMEASICKFTGDDAMTIRKWIADFEDTAESHQLSDERKRLCARRMLDGSAKIFLRSNRATTWERLKDDLIGMFDAPLPHREVIRQMSQRRIKPNESTTRYFLVMREIASQGHIEDKELIHYIAWGIDDKTGVAAQLYFAKSLDELREMLRVFDEIRGTKSASTRPGQTPTGKPTTTATTSTAKTPAEGEVRCYNCRQLGHLRQDCKRPERPANGCFVCFEVGHTYKECPKRQRKPTVAAVVTEEQAATVDESEGTIAADVAAIQLVSVTVPKGSEQCTINDVVCLFDTGSPVSFVCRTVIPNVKPCDPVKDSEYRGLGGRAIQQFGTLTCTVVFNQIRRDIPFIIVAEDILPTKILLGRDALRAFNVKLVLSKDVPNTGNPKIGYIRSVNKAIQIESVRKSIFCAKPLPRELDSECAVDVLREADPCVSRGLIDSDPGMNPAGDDLIAEFDRWSASTSIVLGDNRFSTDFGTVIDANFHELFDRCYVNARRPPVSPPKHSIGLHLTDSTPFHCSPRRLSYGEREVVARMIDDLLRQGIIRPSRSPYASPIVLVKKKTGEYRMCVDYRGLNRLTVRDNFPLPLIEDCLEYLEGKRCFSIMDLKSGFHQVMVDEDSVKYTSFVTPHGQYEYTRMPFGLKNGPAVFQRFITSILDDLIRTRKIVVYMDDIIVATKTPLEHLELLRLLFTRLTEYHLDLKMSKCQFMRSTIDYLSYTVSSLGIRPNDTHIRAIKAYPMPTSLNEVHSCCGLFSYFRRFVPSYSRVAAPLTNLLRKETPFKITAEARLAFETLKKAISEPPVLAI